MALTDMVTRQWQAETCCSCAVEFAVPMSLYQARRNDQKTFYCPNGHPQSYVESEETRLRRRADAAELALAAVRQERDSLSAKLEQCQKRAKRPAPKARPRKTS